jgi:hypothetical protein
VKLVGSEAITRYSIFVYADVYAVYTDRSPHPSICHRTRLECICLVLFKSFQLS